ncbi:hypothetical protein E2542_SST16788 [Spatholobus suberectus]|nr:hypothetical protein E2542_SST30572 [Spatholobus suberectus]TKY59695.1 hypothetical protein E2542_SST16788 [Spatholobus suberectus]
MEFALLFSCGLYFGKHHNESMGHSDVGDQFILMVSQKKWLECFFSLCNSAIPSLGAFWTAFILCQAFAICSNLILYVVSMAKQPFIVLEFTNNIENVHILECIN